MELLQNIDPSLLPYIGVACALLCLILIVIGFVLQAVSGFFDVIVGLMEIVVEILQGGPVAWCGCVLLVAGLLGCSGLVFLYLNAPASCAEHATNFCRWFGFIP